MLTNLLLLALIVLAVWGMVRAGGESDGDYGQDEARRDLALRERRLQQVAEEQVIRDRVSKILEEMSQLRPPVSREEALRHIGMPMQESDHDIR